MIQSEEFISRLERLESQSNEQALLQKEMLTFKEASLYLDISHSNLYHKTHMREVPHFCPNGKKLYFKRSELDQWLQRNRKVTKEELEKEAARYSFNKVSV